MKEAPRNPGGLRKFAGPGLLIVVALAAAVAALLSRGTALAHNVTAGGLYTCAGGWSYAASYVNGGGGGSGDNRLAVVDVNVGGTIIKEYHYFDTLTTHPAPPAGFIVVDHPTVVSFQLFSLSGGTSPITVSGSIKLYEGGSSFQPSGDPAYRRYLPQFSQNPIPQPAAATGCATSTATRTPTPSVTPSPTATSTSTSTPTLTSTPTSTATTAPSFEGLTLSAGQQSVSAGIASVPLNEVPLSVVGDGNAPSASKLSSIKLSSILLSSIKLSSIKLSSIKLSSIELSNVQLSSIPIAREGGWEAVLDGTELQGVPLQQIKFVDALSLVPPPAALDPASPEALTLAEIDLSGTSLGSLSLAAVALGPTKLSSIAPPAPASDWCAALEETDTTCSDLGYTSTTINDASLLELNVRGAKLSSIKLSSIKLSSIDLAEAGLATLKLSSIPVQDLKLSSIKLSSIPLTTLTSGSLASIKLSSIEVQDGASDWCAYFASAGYDCATLGLTEESTLSEAVAAFEAAGAGLAASPLGVVKLSSIKLSSIDLAALKLSSIPIESLSIAGIKLSSIKLSSIGVQSSFLSPILLSSIPAANLNQVADCSLVDCTTATLGQAEAAGALRPDATLGLLGTYGDGTVLDVVTKLGASQADVEYFLSFFYDDASLLAEVAAGVVVNLDELTLGDLLLAILLRSDYPWEDVPLDALTAADLPGSNTVTYRATFTSTGGGVASELAVVLPRGFYYERGSSTLTVVGSGAPVTSTLSDPAVSGRELTWTLPPFLVGDDVTVEFQVRPGVELGIQTSAASLTAAGFSGLAVSNQAPVAVTENFEPNDDPATAPIVEDDVLYLSHVSTNTDRDYFRLPAVPVGARVNVYLSHQAQDNDLALFLPGVNELRPPGDTKLSSIPLEDAVPDILANEAPPRTLQDIDLAPLPLGDLSDMRGTLNESVQALSLGETGFYTLEFAGYNGAASDEPYVFRVKVTPPPAIPQCPAKSFPFGGEGSTGTLPGVVPATTNTLFIVNKKRLGDLYGAAAADQVMASLFALSARADLGVRGAVLSVDGNAGIAGAYAAWDQNPCSPVAANGVVAQINTLVDGYRMSTPDLANIVVVGGDAVVPFARVPDVTRISNEKDYTNDALDIAGNNELVGSFLTSNILSDDPYGSFSPIGVMNRGIYVPEVALGRLVESPEQITAQVAQFIQFEGKLDPTSALTTGYDFLTDGADEVSQGLDEVVGGANSEKLINDSWTSADLSTAFDQHVPVPGAGSINAHFDHYRLLPGAGNTTGDESDLYTTANVAREPLAPTILDGAILFSMGCHSGLNVSDLLAPSPNADQAARLLDWPEAFADQAAAIYVANTGYGYGDTETVAYSERLMGLFSDNLDSTRTVGEALASAKREYFIDRVHLQTYDEKVLAQTTFYGLPMFRVASATPTSPVTPTMPFVTDPISGVAGVSIDLNPTFDEVDLGAKGTYYTINGQAEAASGRPVQPTTGLNLPTGANGATARGIVITDLQSTDTAGVNGVFSKPGSDTGVPEQPSGGTFPASIHSLTTADGPNGLLQRAMFMPGQFIADAGAPTGVGTQRLYTSISAFVTYSNSPDVTPPTILETHAATVGGVVTFTASVEDDVPNNVKRVAVLYKPETSGDWTLLDLVLDPASGRWTGAAFVESAVQYTLYALDAAGNVGLSTNKGEFHRTIAAPSASGIAVVVDGTQASGGWLFDATVTITGPEDVPLTYKVDNGPAQVYSGPFAVTGTGIHLVTAEGSDGSTGGAIVPLDDVGPTVAFVAPFDGASYVQGQPVLADYLCLDAGSGVESCVGPVPVGSPIDTSTPGLHTFEVQARDVAGTEGIALVSYEVSCLGDIDCDVVADPVDNCPLTANHQQENFDSEALDNGSGIAGDDETNPNGDPLGDVCDEDDDNDDLSDALDLNPLTSAGACAIFAGSFDGHEMPSAGDSSYSDGDPPSWDSDGDAVRDGTECAIGSNPRMPSDEDRARCAQQGSTDTDDDGLLDDWETCGWGTDPNVSDTDGDGLGDCIEVMDVNGNGLVTNADAVLVKQEVFGVTIGDRSSMDTNRSGLVTNADATFVQRAVFRVGNCS